MYEIRQFQICSNKHETPLVLLGRMDIMTTVKSKLLVDSQNSFLVYHFKSLNLVQNNAMNETFITIAGH